MDKFSIVKSIQKLQSHTYVRIQKNPPSNLLAELLQHFVIEGLVIDEVLVNSAGEKIYKLTKRADIWRTDDYSG